MKVPTGPLSLMYHSYSKIFPTVHKELEYWKQKADAIPNLELRKQALASIDTKTFHCEGGAILTLLAMKQFKTVIRFVVAYQTISDYLDNLCDRSTSLDPKDFSALHESMEHALTINATHTDYYRYREDKNDGGYLDGLVSTCQQVLSECNHYPLIKRELIRLCSVYCELQIHKHVHIEERVPRLQNWFKEYEAQFSDLHWYEFSACTGSTLGIFCLVSYAFRKDFKVSYVQAITSGYFPYIQGLHILLDYLIDQEEDRLGGDLNFCFYYKSNEHLLERLQMFVEKADSYTKDLPDRQFHQLINRGLLGIYLSDPKLLSQEGVKTAAKSLIRKGGTTSYFFFVNAKGYRKWRDMVSRRDENLSPQKVREKG